MIRNILVNHSQSGSPILYASHLEQWLNIDFSMVNPTRMNLQDDRNNRCHGGIDRQDHVISEAREATISNEDG